MALSWRCFLIRLIFLVCAVASSAFAAAHRFSSVENFVFQHKTNAFLVLEADQDEPVFERYEQGFDKNSRNPTHSVFKSVVAVVLGQAIFESSESANPVELDDSICKYLPEARNAGKCGITLGALVTHSSGIDWNEGYEHDDITKSSVLGMLYGFGAADMMSFVLSYRWNPMWMGRRWSYSSGDSLLLAAALKSYYGKRFGSVLNEPLGLKNTTWEVDPKWVPFSYYSSARDLGAIGRLMLKRGMWNSKRIFSDDWYDFQAKTPASYNSALSKLLPGDVPGASWWVNRATEKQKRRKPMPDALEDILFAQGHWGQLLIINPSQKQVIVRFGEDTDKGFDRYAMMNEMLKRMPKAQRGAK